MRKQLHGHHNHVALAKSIMDTMNGYVAVTVQITVLVNVCTVLQSYTVAVVFPSDLDSN